MNLLEAAAHARNEERFEAVRAAVLAAKKAQYEFNIKGGAGSGEIVGHAFHGNRYTGGRAEGAGYVAHPRLSAVKRVPHEFARLKALTRKSTAAFDKAAYDNLKKWDSTAISDGPKIKDGVVKELVRASTGAHWDEASGTWESTKAGLTYSRANAMIETWARSSTDTTPDSVALQAAVAEKFGVPLGDYLTRQAAYMDGGFRKDLEAGPPEAREDTDVNGVLRSTLTQGPNGPEYGTMHTLDEDQVRAWDTKLNDFYSAVKMSEQMDPITSFTIPKSMAVETMVYYGTNGYVARPWPGFGTRMYTPSEGYSQTKLEDGSIRFVRDNTLIAAGPGGTAYGQPAAEENQPLSWYQRLNDATVTVDAIYAHTQEVLAANGVKELTVFRGMGWYQGNDIPDSLLVKETLDGRPINPADAGTKAGENDLQINLNPLSSFSVNAHTAEQFGSGSRAAVFAVTVPANRVFSLASTGPGCTHEGEVVVIGGPTDLVGGRGYPAGPEGNATGLSQSAFYG